MDGTPTASRVSDIPVPDTACGAEDNAQSSLDRLAALVARAMNVPMVLIWSMDESGRNLLGQFGLADWDTVSRLLATCAWPCHHVLGTGEPLVLADLRQDPRFASIAPLRSLSAAGYLGVPIQLNATSSCAAIGIMTHEPRNWVSEDLVEVQAHATLIADLVDARTNAERLTIVLDHVPDAVMFFDAAHKLVLANRRTRQIYGLSDCDLAPGATKDQLFNARQQRGNHPVGTKDNYLRWLTSQGTGNERRQQDFLLHDGRTIRVRAQTTPEGEFVISHADVTEAVETQKALQQSEQMHRLVTENISEVIVLGSENGRRQYHSAAIERLLGYSPEEAQRIRTRDHAHPDDLGALKQTTAALSKTSPTGLLRYRARHKAGHFVWVEASYRWFCLPDGSPAIVTLLRDVSERMKVEAAHDRMFNQSAMGMFRLDTRGHPMRVNQTLSNWLGYWNGDALVDDLGSVACAWPCKDQRFKDFIQSVWRQGSANGFRTSLRNRKTGEIGHFSIAAWLIEDTDRRSRSVEGCVLNITEQVRAEKRLEHLANHDWATGLPNKAAFLSQMTYDLAAMAVRTDRAALILIDVSDLYHSHRFLSPNQRACIIPELVARLQEVTGGNEYLGRTKSDQFAVFLGPRMDDSDIVGLANALLCRLGQPLQLGAIEIEIATCIGFAELAVGAPNTAETLWRNAEIALNQAKEAGPNSVVRFNEALEQRYTRDVAIETALRQTPLPGNFGCVYQPQVDLRDGRIIGYEALARWTHHQLGIVPPTEFIAIAERSGTIQNIAWILFGKACELATHLPPDMRLAINLSPVQLRHPGFIEQMEKILNARDIAPTRIELELTENVLIDSSADIVMQLDHLRQIGFTIAIDDFGTGFSSLSYLTKFPFDRIKIDRSFIREVNQDEPAMILRSVLGMCKAMNKDVIVEGVETIEQADWLVRHGAQYGQGFLFGRPLEKVRVLATLK